MWEECDLAEDYRVKKQNPILNKKVIKTVVIILTTFICIALLFTITYVYTSQRISKAAAEEKASGKNEEPIKAFELEKRILEQIDNKNKN